MGRGRKVSQLGKVAGEGNRDTCSLGDQFTNIVTKTVLNIVLLWSKMS